MIYGSTTHPVLVKKIPLRVWRLRDEIEALVEKEVDISDADLSGIASTYKTDYINTKAPAENFTSEAPENEQEDQEKAATETLTAKEGDAPAEKKKEKVASEGTSSHETHLFNIPKDKIYKARTILAEIYMDKMYIFCSEKFIIGQSIVIQFEIPKPFILNAEITYCLEFNMQSRIISEKKMPYRASLRFTFVKPGERENLRTFLKSIEPKIETAKKSKKSSDGSEDTDDNNFADLENLDI